MKLIGIACVNFNRAIGLNNKLLYKIPADMAFFKKTTTNTNNFRKNAVLMGSNTFLSIPSIFKPLNNRVNLIVSKENYSNIKSEIQNNKYPDSYVFPNIEQSIQNAKNKNDIENLYIIGGQTLYNYFIKKQFLDYMWLTEITRPKFNIGDTFFPKFNKNDFFLESSSKQTCYNITSNLKNNHKSTVIPTMDINFSKYINTNKKSFDFKTDENSYLNTIRDVLNTGEKRGTRNSETISKFGLKMEFDINKGFPLLTTKKVYWKGVVEELLWFIRADTNAKNLNKKGVKIWNKNSSKELFVIKVPTIP